MAREPRKRKRRWIGWALKLNPWTAWGHRSYKIFRVIRRNRLIRKAITVRRIRRLIKLVKRYQQGEVEVFAKISKLVGAVVGVVVSFAFLQLPFVANLGWSEEGVAGWLTTAILTALGTYFAPKNAGT